MGAYACVWVHWGIGGTGNTKTRQRGGNHGHTGPDLGPMTGEISPNIMFCKKTKKNTRLTLDGCAWVRIGWVGYMHVERGSNERKRDING